MSNIKRFLLEDVDVTPESLDELEAQGAVMSMQTFVDNYRPDSDNHYDVMEADSENA